MNKNNVLDVLMNAKDLLSNKEAWTKGAYVVNKDGVPLKLYDNSDDNFEAVAYCLFGALCPTFNSDYGVTIKDNLDAMKLIHLSTVKKTDFDNIIKFNDCETTTHKEVIGILDYTIRKLLKETENDNGVCET